MANPIQKIMDSNVFTQLIIEYVAYFEDDWYNWGIFEVFSIEIAVLKHHSFEFNFLRELDQPMKEIGCLYNTILNWW